MSRQRVSADATSLGQNMRHAHVMTATPWPHLPRLSSPGRISVAQDLGDEQWQYLTRERLFNFHATAHDGRARFIGSAWGP